MQTEQSSLSPTEWTVTGILTVSALLCTVIPRVIADIIIIFFGWEGIPYQRHGLLEIGIGLLGPILFFCIILYLKPTTTKEEDED
jgi:hypothetical protein